jgi:uncharacterized protein (DUF433 family)
LERSSYKEPTVSKAFVEPNIIELAPLMLIPESMTERYVERLGNAYKVAGSRVSLDSVVYAFLNGQSPEGIVDSFPTLSLEQVYGAITFYLSNRDEIDAYLKQGEEEFESLRRASRQSNPQLYKKLEEARHPSSSPRS